MRARQAPTRMASIASRMLARWLVAVASTAAALMVAGSVHPVASAADPRSAAVSAATKADPSVLGEARHDPHAVLPLILRKTTPESTAVERLVRELGGRVTLELPLIESVAVHLPARSLPAVLRSPAVKQVSLDAHLRAMGNDMSQYDSYAQDTTWKNSVEPDSASGSNGASATVALIDTGISRVADLGNRVLARVDFTPDHDGYDRYGHGTHMAGIIAGDGTSSNGQYLGVAPQAKLVSVKVAGANGATDVSVVIAGMQWVVSHRAQYNIRVLNLSYGTNSKQSYLVDPLDYAVERVWFSGIFVVVAAGNRGPASGTVSKPGDDPFVMTVGAADTRNTVDRSDDLVAPFSGRGPTQDGVAKPDLVAPGISIVSNRAVGSTIDQLHPSARVGAAYFKGTGTSQSTAIVSGVAALMFAQSPSLTPDIAKAIMLRTADRRITANLGGSGAGAGLVDVNAAVNQVAQGYWWITPANRGLVRSTGQGSIEASRGSAHVKVDLNGDGVPDLVIGEIDVFGNSWDKYFWGGNSWDGNSWEGSSWNSSTWSCYVFVGNSWDGNSWDGNTWAGNSWSGMTWAGNSWDGNSWDGNSWDGNSWNGSSWN